MNQPGHTQSINRIMGFTEWSLLILLSMIWGGSFFFVELLVRELPPLTIVLGRVSLASLILLIVVRATGNRMPSSLKTWSWFLVMGLLNNVVPFCLIVWGQTHISGGLASILNATTPVFSVVLAHFLTSDERMTTNRVYGVVIGWTGVAVLIGIDALRQFGAESWGQLSILGASLSYAFAAIFAQRLKKLKPMVVATGMLTCSAVIMTPLALIIDQPWNLSPGGTTLAAWIGLAVVCTSVAYLIYFKLLSSAGATNSVLVTFLVPISAITLGGLFLGERLSWNAWMGMGLISIGLFLIDGRLLRRHKKLPV